MTGGPCTSRSTGRSAGTTSSRVTSSARSVGRLQPFFYHRQNFCIFSQLLGKAIGRVELKLNKMAEKSPELEFDMAAALGPLRVLIFTFSTNAGGCSRTVEDCLANPLTLLGLREHPWYFDMNKGGYDRLLRSRETEKRVGFSWYHASPEEDAERRDRRKQKKVVRQRVAAEKPQLFHPVGTKVAFIKVCK